MGRPTDEYLNTIRSTGYGSDRYGLCEVCSKHCTEHFVHTRRRVFIREDGLRYLNAVGACTFGHKDCFGPAIDESTLRRTSNLLVAPGEEKMTNPEITTKNDTPSHSIALRSWCTKWASGVEKSSETRVLKDIEQMISELESIRSSARQALPIELGGFGGLERDQAIKLLVIAKIEVYETEGGYFGYSGCEADQWEHFDDALSAALQEHPEVVPTTLDLTVTGEVTAS